MSKMNWNRPKYVHDGVRAWEPKVDNPKSLPKEHDGHKLIASPSVGPHYAKLTCMSCGNKFVKWLSKEQYHWFKSMG